MKFSLDNEIDTKTMGLEDASSEGTYKRAMLTGLNLATVTKVNININPGGVTGIGTSKKGDIYLKAQAHLLKIELETKEYSPIRFFVAFTMRNVGFSPFKNSEQLRMYFRAMQEEATILARNGYITRGGEIAEEDIVKAARQHKIEGSTRKDLLGKLAKVDGLYVSVYSAQLKDTGLPSFKALIEFLDLRSKMEPVMALVEVALQTGTKEISNSIDIDNIQLYIENDPEPGKGKVRQFNLIGGVFNKEKLSLEELRSLKSDPSFSGSGNELARREKALEHRRAADIAYREKRAKEYREEKEKQNLPSEEGNGTAKTVAGSAEEFSSSSLEFEDDGELFGED